MTDPGWHPDPTGRHNRRYHDGSTWTDHVTDAAGNQSNDPFTAPPGSGAAAPAGGAGASSTPGTSTGAPHIGAPPPRQGGAAQGSPSPAASPTAATGGPAPSTPPGSGAAAPTVAAPPTPGAPSPFAPPAGGTPAPPAGGPAPAYGAPPGTPAYGAAQPAWSPAPGAGPGVAAPGSAVEGLSVGGLALAAIGTVLGLLSLFLLPWISGPGTGSDNRFLDAREVGELGILGAAAGGLVINLAYFVLVAGAAVAFGKAAGARGAAFGAAGVVVVAFLVLAIVGFTTSSPLEGASSFSGGVGTSSSSGFNVDDPGDRLTGTAVMTGGLMFLATVLTVAGLLARRWLGRILCLVGLGLVGTFTLLGVAVLGSNLDDLGGGFVDLGVGIGGWLFVLASLLMTISVLIPGRTKQA